MKYLKTYRIFESKESEDSLVNKYIEFFNNADIILNIHMFTSDYDNDTNVTSYNNGEIESHCSLRFWKYTEGTIYENTYYKGSKLMNLSPEVSELLGDAMFSKFKYLERLLQYIKLLTNNKVEFDEIRNRFEEFEVVKDNKLDYISLNNVFDFYEIPFSEDDIQSISHLDWKAITILAKERLEIANVSESYKQNILFNTDVNDDSLVQSYINFFKSHDIITNVVVKLGDNNARTCYYNDEIYSYNHDDMTFIYRHDRKERLDVSLNQSDELGRLLYSKYLEYRKILYYISLILDDKGSIESKISLTNSRFEEFDVIKNHQIDYISLNNLFDFYNKPFINIEETINKVRNETWAKIKLRGFEYHLVNK